MNRILLPNKTYLHLDFRTQTGSENRPFNLSGIRLDLSMPPEWVEPKTLRHFTWYEFRYMDDRSKGFDLLLCPRDKYVKVLLKK